MGRLRCFLQGLTSTMSPSRTSSHHCKARRSSAFSSEDLALKAHVHDNIRQHCASAAHHPCLLIGSNMARPSLRKAFCPAQASAPDSFEASPG